MNWVIIATGLIFLICVVVGLYRGAVKIAVSLAATIVTFILVFFLTPYVSQGIMAVTPLDEMIESQAEQSIMGMASSVLQGDEGESGSGLTVENVRRVLESAGITEAQLNAAGITVEDIVNGNVTSDELAQYGISSSLLDGLQGSSEAESILEDVEIPRDTQIAAIEGADIPGVFKALLLNNNNSETYDELGVDNFIQYISAYATRLIINILSFILTFVVITVVMRAVIFALDIVANLPVLGFFNRLGGALLGAAGGLIIVWILFMLITMLYTTSFGREAYDVIQGNDILRVIYEYNPVLKMAVSFK
nr:CvpA family protein [uncultured Lachnoclostridium sp.]